MVGKEPDRESWRAKLWSMVAPAHLTNHTIIHLITLPFVTLILYAAQLLFRFVSKLLGIEITPPPEGWWLFAYELLENFYAYLNEHPWHVIGGAIILQGLITIGRMVIRVVIKFSRQQLALDRIGLIQTWSENDSDKEAAWEFCREKIRLAGTDLRILGATGWRTFGAEDSPLHEILGQFSGTVQVLLADPRSQAVRDRMLSVGAEEMEYLLEIKRSLKFLEAVNRRTGRITVKLYNQPLIWKLIIAGDFLWLQHYRHGKHVDETPVFGYSSHKSQSSYFYPLYQVFEKRWEKDGLSALAWEDVDGIFRDLQPDLPSKS